VIEERRHFPRFRADYEMHGSLLARVDEVEREKLLLRGEIENIARGGMCVLSDQPVPTNSVVRCELMSAGSSVGIPTLLRVRWFEKAIDKSGFRLGLQFLL
jgi:PilZ domain